MITPCTLQWQNLHNSTHTSLYRLPQRIKPLWTVKLYKSWTFRARFLNGPLMMPFWEGIKASTNQLLKGPFCSNLGLLNTPNIIQKGTTAGINCVWHIEHGTKEVFLLHKLSLLLSANFLQLPLTADENHTFHKVFLLQLPARLENISESYTALNPTDFSCWD